MSLKFEKDAEMGKKKCLQYKRGENSLRKIPSMVERKTEKISSWKMKER